MKKKVLIACGLFAVLLLGFWLGHARPRTTAQGRLPLYYVDPMHPSYRSDKPGTAPDCGMKLEPVYADELPLASQRSSGRGITVAADKQQLIGIATQRVSKSSGEWTLRTSGRVEADASRVYRVLAATLGYVSTAESRPAGALVKKDEQLATFYSEEFRNAEQAYLGSVASIERVKGPHEPEMADTSLHINEGRLRSLGMGEAQIKDLAKSRQVTRDIALASPVDGVVLTNNVTPSLRFDKGDELYRIADLTKVYILADVTPDQAKVLKPGTRVRVDVPEVGKTLYASVTTEPPLFDNVSHTLKVRLQANNPGMVLRPDMFVDLEFSTPLPAGLYVPQEAVLDSGRQKIVYAETSDEMFEPRSVVLGTAFGNQIAVLSGINEGDRIVTSGHFLIDSEARMRSVNLTAGTSDPALAGDHDPVCGMPLGPNERGHSTTYKGETFSFCSEQCKKKFEHDPTKYAADKLGFAAISESGTHD